jgi:hypothetical protein
VNDVVDLRTAFNLKVFFPIFQLPFEIGETMHHFDYFCSTKPEENSSFHAYSLGIEYPLFLIDDVAGADDATSAHDVKDVRLLSICELNFNNALVDDDDLFALLPKFEYCLVDFIGVEV